MGRGLLVFKGDKPPAHKKKLSSKSKKKRSDRGSKKTEVPLAPSHAGLDSGGGEHSQPKAATAAAAAAAAPAAPEVRKGTGRITSSGTVVTGMCDSTKFASEFSAGDAILVRHCGGGSAAAPPGEGEQEMRVVTMRLSDSSCAISSAFSKDLKSPTDFWYICKPRDVRAEERKKQDKAVKDKIEEERVAFGTYAASKNELVYREKTETGSYAIRTERLDRDVRRSDLLDMRSKKKSDKYCH